MSDSFHPELRDLFLDGLLAKQQVDELLENAEDREDLIREKSLQDEIDLGLRSSFQFDVPDTDQIIDRLIVESPAQSNPASRRQFIQLVLAASLLLAAGGIVWKFWLPGGGTEVVFKSQPLVEVYSDLVDREFVPYYECDDQQRFAEVFAKRQNQPLVLADLPDGQSMLGLSYLGGLSRDTTAMLCIVDEQKVIVFVDRIENDDQEMALDGDGLRVFREERDGLVFYEVTPLDVARMTEFMKSPE